MKWTDLKKGMRVKLRDHGSQWYGGATAAIVVTPRAYYSVCTFNDGFLTDVRGYNVYNRDMAEAMPATCIMRGV